VSGSFKALSEKFNASSDRRIVHISNGIKTKSGLMGGSLVME